MSTFSDTQVRNCRTTTDSFNHLTTSHSLCDEIINIINCTKKSNQPKFCF